MSKPVSNEIAEICHTVNAMLVPIRTCVSVRPARFSAAHSHPLKKPSSVISAMMTPVVLIRAMFRNAFSQSALLVSTAPNVQAMQ